MPRFRKKPLVIEAEQYTQTGLYIDGVCYGIDCDCAERKEAHIHTNKGVMTVSLGDWVITGVQGEKYACKPDIFEATYEAAD